MKKYVLIVYIAIVVIIGYFLLKKKNKSSSSGSPSGTSNGLADILGLTANGNVNPITSLASGLLNYQYNGKPLYGVYNNISKASDSIGFTALGVAIKMANVIWSESAQEYIDKPSDSGSGSSGGGSGSGGSSGSQTGPSVVQSYTYNGQPLYNYFNGIPLSSGALGYLSTGSVILINNVEFINGEWTDKNSNGHLV